MKNPIKVLSVYGRVLWIVSMIFAAASNLFAKEVDPLTLIAALIGVTSLIFAAKGYVIAHLIPRVKRWH